MIAAILKVVLSLQGPREDDFGCSHGVHSKLLYVCRTIPSNFYPSPRSSPMLHHMIDSHACTAIIIACLVSYRASIKNKTPRKRSTPVAQVPIL